MCQTKPKRNFENAFINKRVINCLVIRPFIVKSDGVKETHETSAILYFSYLDQFLTQEHDITMIFYNFISFTCLYIQFL